ncbi:uncharacterized protein LOC122651604 [Telopea speciosissima]|uniref:uncharacterized protein LOC122651604 n=1 Tax=Telopea speciosissima TaxID=54955 RepID=UPI001CC62D4D|nr:uncharacterized protein LOC122651604 [Telopea speciosissima]
MGRCMYTSVDSLIVDGDQWAEDVADPSTHSRWTEISTTRIHGRLSSDTIMWCANLKGVFPLKLEWDSIRARRDPVAWYKLVWFPYSQTRFSFIVWLAIVGRFTTKSRLAAWGLATDTTCPLCNTGNEDLNHLFFKSPFSNHIWQRVLLLNGFALPALLSWPNVVQWTTNHFTGDSLLNKVRRFSFSVMVYRIWSERNSRIFKQQESSFEKVLCQIIGDTRGRFSGSVAVAPDSSATRDFFHRWRIKVQFTLQRPSFHSWLRPPSNCMAINCDGSVMDGRGGYGAMACDRMGRVIFAIAGGFRDTNIMRMELEAIRCGLRRANSLGCPRIHVQSDSLCAIQMIKGSFHTPWHCLELLEDILCLKEKFSCCTFAHVAREANFCADFLASFLHSDQEILLSTNCLPPALACLVGEDARGRRYQRL